MVVLPVAPAVIKAKELPVAVVVAAVQSTRKRASAAVAVQRIKQRVNVAVILIQKNNIV